MRGFRVMQSVLALCLIVSPALAQRGGNGNGGSGRGARINGGAPRANVPRPGNNNSGRTGTDFWGGRPYPVRTDIAPPTGLIAPAAAYTGIAPGGSRTIGPRSRYPFVPIIGSPILYPGAYDYGPSSVAPYNDPNGDVVLNSNMMASQDAMAEQIRRLSSDLEQMKSAASLPAPVSEAAPAAAPAPVTETIPIQIVLHNGEKVSSKSYAVMGGTLWDFSSSRVRKIPVSSINITASTKATEDQGGEFPQLRSN